jgi:predicted nuclease of restriction endonuclease-like RecB superfamily
MEVESIETFYNNILFRSRLEARWAIFWDVLQVKYEYEPEKFDLGEIVYIPDFWLPERKKWVEIKGQTPNDTEMKKRIYCQ